MWAVAADRPAARAAATAAGLATISRVGRMGMASEFFGPADPKNSLDKS
jgi:hypothetical protein